jgi:hypothetical protein
MELGMKAAALVARALAALRLGRAAEAVANAALARVDEDTPYPVIAPLHAVIATVRLRRGDENAALEHALRSHHYRPSEEVQTIVRVLDGQYSPDSMHFRILVRGRAHLEFLRKYDVVADDEDEALRLIKRTEHPDFRDSLALEECELLGRSPNNAKGVAWCSGRMLLPGDGS